MNHHHTGHDNPSHLMHLGSRRATGTFKRTQANRPGRIFSLGIAILALLALAACETETPAPSISAPAANNAPSATSATITTAEDTASTGVTPPVTDVDAGDSHTFNIITQPTNGTASIVGNQLVYTPNADFNGNDSFTFSATDTGGLSVNGTANVTVTPVNDAPTATSAAITTAEDTASAGVTPPVTDVDAGDSHTFNIITQPTNGTASIVGNQLVYTPNADFNGNDSFAFSATDTGGLSVNGTANVTVTAVNDAPLITAPVDHGASPGAAAAINALVAIPLNLDVTSADPDAGDTLTYSIDTAPTGGSLSGPVAVDAFTSTFTYTANAGTVVDSFVVRVADTAGASDPLTVNVSAAPPNLTVNSTVDAPDANPGDGICDEGTGVCALRAAIEEANALPGANTINVNAGTYVLTLGPLPTITDEVTITGAGAASTIVDGNANSRVFSIAANLPSVTLEDLTIQNGHASGARGGGVNVGSNTPTLIRRVILSSNRANDGNAIALSGSSNVTVVDSTVTGNFEPSSILVLAGDQLTIRSSTLSLNRGNVITDGSGAGGGAPVTINIENSTIVGNGGAAVHARSIDTINIINSTITNNDTGISAASVGIVTQVNVTNTILYGNSRNCFVHSGGIISSGGHNIDSGNTCGFAAVGDLVNTVPMLGPLADNGGLTQTRGLLAGSPGLDAGDNAVCPVVDQRGVARNDGFCDIGAVEGSVAFATCLPANVIVTSAIDAVDANIGDGVCDDGVGNCTLRAAIQETNACVGDDVIDVLVGTYLLNIAGAGEDVGATGDLDIYDNLSINGAGSVNTIIDGNGAVLNDRVFDVHKSVTTAFDGLTIQNGNIGGHGGAIQTAGEITVSNSAVSGNTSSDSGGAIANFGAARTVTISNSVFSNNSAAARGGAVYVTGNVIASGSTFSTNAVTGNGQGGAVHGVAGATITIDASSVLDDNSGGLAAVYGFENTTIDIIDSTVSNSGVTAVNSTRGIFGVANSIINITRSTISGNQGGGVESLWNSSPAGLPTLNITDSTIDGNGSLNTGKGGGVYSDGNLTISGSVISNNVSRGGGGGVYSFSRTAPSTVKLITNSTISGNRCWLPGFCSGGGIEASGTGPVFTLVNTTIVGNSSTLPGGGLTSHNQSNITNVIIDANSPDNCSVGTGGSIISGGHNIDSANTCGFASVGDLINTNPLLGALGNNGGLTQTHALQAGSPAIDAGDDAVCAAAPVNGVDQRGVARPQGPQCDIGAYEAP